MLLTWFILFQFYDIKSLVNFSNKIEKLVKFRLQTQKKFPMFMSKNDTNCQKKKVQTTLFSTPLEKLVLGVHPPSVEIRIINSGSCK
jgi:hypothetical protein